MNNYFKMGFNLSIATMGTLMLCFWTLITLASTATDPNTAALTFWKRMFFGLGVGFTGITVIAWLLAIYYWIKDRRSRSAFRSLLKTFQGK